jgi:hypothetical protein
MFDLDYIGPKVTENLRAQRTSQHAGQVKNACSVKWKVVAIWHEFVLRADICSSHTKTRARQYSIVYVETDVLVEAEPGRAPNWPLPTNRRSGQK